MVVWWFVQTTLKFFISIYCSLEVIESHDEWSVTSSWHNLTVFSRSFTCSEEADYCIHYRILQGLFIKLTELTSNWSSFNRFGQFGQIYGLEDMNCTLASKLAKNQTKVRDRLSFLHFL